MLQKTAADDFNEILKAFETLPHYHSYSNCVHKSSNWADNTNRPNHACLKSL